MKRTLLLIIIVLITNYSYGENPDYIGRITDIIEFEIYNGDIYALVKIDKIRHIIVFPVKYASSLRIWVRVYYTGSDKRRHYLGWWSQIEND